MAERNPPGDSITSRLLSRTDPGLSRRRMTDGGEVYTGTLARRALRALGARAFTMGGTIFVDPGFDASKPEGAALYAHERHHQGESGGEGGNRAGQHDKEEKEALAIEEMVFHRIQSGEDIGDILHDVTTGAAANVAKGGEQAKTGGPAAELVSRAIIGGDKDRDPMEAYWQMRAEGWPHKMIVDELRDHVVENLSRLQEEHSLRTGGEADFIGTPLARR